MFPRHKTSDCIGFVDLVTDCVSSVSQVRLTYSIKFKVFLDYTIQNIIEIKYILLCLIQNFYPGTSSMFFPSVGPRVRRTKVSDERFTGPVHRRDVTRTEFQTLFVQLDVDGSYLVVVYGVFK